MIAIYTADWIFYTKDNTKVIAPNIVTKRILLEFLSTYDVVRRAIRDIVPTVISSLQKDKKSGIYKFDIRWNKKVGEVNDSLKHLEGLH